MMYNNSCFNDIYSPAELIDADVLTYQDGLYIVNREQLKEKYDRDFKAAFIKTLHHDYGWSFSNFNQVNIYFILEGNSVFGGVLGEGRKIETKRKVFGFKENGTPTCYIDYIYSGKNILDFIDVLTRIKLSGN